MTPRSVCARLMTILVLLTPAAAQELELASIQSDPVSGTTAAPELSPELLRYTQDTLRGIHQAGLDSREARVKAALDGWSELFWQHHRWEEGKDPESKLLSLSVARAGQAFLGMLNRHIIHSSVSVAEGWRSVNDITVTYGSILLNHMSSPPGGLTSADLGPGFDALLTSQHFHINAKLQLARRAGGTGLAGTLIERATAIREELTRVDESGRPGRFQDGVLLAGPDGALYDPDFGHILDSRDVLQDCDAYMVTINGIDPRFTRSYWDFCLHVIDVARTENSKDFSENTLAPGRENHLRDFTDILNAHTDIWNKVQEGERQGLLDVVYLSNRYGGFLSLMNIVMARIREGDRQHAHRIEVLEKVTYTVHRGARTALEVLDKTGISVAIVDSVADIANGIGNGDGAGIIASQIGLSLLGDIVLREREGAALAKNIALAFGRAMAETSKSAVAEGGSHHPDRHLAYEFFVNFLLRSMGSTAGAFKQTEQFKNLAAVFAVLWDAWNGPVTQ